MEKKSAKAFQLFLSVLADYLNGRSTVLPPEYDEAALLDYARQQQCEGIVYYQTNLPSLQQTFITTICNSVKRGEIQKEIHNAFSERNIPYLIFKGTEVARFYPVPTLRTMGDSDILIRKEDKKRADETLTSIGFQGNTMDRHESHYRKDKMVFEIHPRLLYDVSVNPPHLISWTETVWEHVSVEDGVRYSMEAEFNFVCLLLHLRKHLMNYGVGFRQFMDIAVTAQQGLQWDTVNRYLNELGLTAFAANCLSFCSRWFDMTLPMSAKISDEFYETVTEKIFAGGVFGRLEKGNRENSINYWLQNESRIKVFINHVFVPYHRMKDMQIFSFLDGRPYLLPAAWIYRVFLSVKRHGTKTSVRNMLTPLVISDEEISEREKYLKQWGL